MIIGTCIIELRIPGNGSLKGKRRVVKSIVARLHNEFNVSVAEVDDQDLWQSAVLGVACVSNGTDRVHRTLSQVVEWIERNRPDVGLVDYRIEMF
jgi:hypothetical protein